MHLQIHYLFTKFLLTGNLHMFKKTTKHTHTHTQETFEQLKATKRAHQARYDIHILPNLIDLDLLLNPNAFLKEFILHL